MARSKNTTGRIAEEKYCRKLLNDGYIVRRFPRTRYSSRSRFEGQDLWGTDIVAKKDGKTKWVQVKSGSNRMPSLLTATLEELKELWYHCNPKYEEIWWAGYNFDKNEWKEVLLDDIPAMLSERGK